MNKSQEKCKKPAADKRVNVEISEDAAIKIGILAKKHLRSRKSCISILIERGLSDLEANPALADVFFGRSIA